MYPLLSNRATVNPILLINQGSTFGNVESDSQASGSLLEPAGLEDASNLDGSEVVEDDKDPFVPGSAHRGKKKRKNKDNSSEAVTNMLDVFQVRWQEEKEAEATIRQEEKEDRERMLDVMAKSQKSMSDAVDVLKFIAEKM
jgi:hypothetical protein